MVEDTFLHIHISEKTKCAHFLQLRLFGNPVSPYLLELKPLSKLIVLLAE
jgi:hypothetical protein